MSLHDDAVLVLKGYESPDPAQSELRQGYLDHLAQHPDGMWKACGAGHLTASALVVDPERGRVLLTLHRKLRMWLQMGGHCEPQDESLAAAALREATEESGIAGLTLLGGGPVRLDRHPIPAPCHWHLDVQYAALAPSGATEQISEESLDLRWFAYDEVASVADTSVVRLMERTRAELERRR
ncbi:NUDIX hydrolase [Streptomyces sp. NBC_00053]|uniref:NUDIX hydrolase n=1 Tax=unclassified Streptomyces TaxID=2593676 RepID=UPI000F5C10AD|nr:MULTISPECIES: NUDIX hydrolase [unclassified Streptomyces]WSG53236.1 NUDIX hydrolase [Streptomyces sp. NBC_01732]WSX03888.1 NUDIX hydrolase [Streptomyces sp. NBC_00987]MCX4394080.1 NUDIX hydrolase [Streptomyces sp. NBC_01767]MCX5106030.1 NUDIX hydrolase [Streptomyces sp. NBC_00439]MCX5162827.1 NUDIX hydrolase [Streptomyces sp. NBC_00305]